MTASVPQRIGFAIRGPITRADLPGLCERVCALLARSHAAVVLCDVCDVDADAVTVDALARLQLAARRYGCQVRLRNASTELLELVAFMGLDDVLPD
jgi:ABC-type transporter Mla MlaB component